MSNDSFANVRGWAMRGLMRGNLAWATAGLHIGAPGDTLGYTIEVPTMPWLKSGIAFA